MGDDQSDYSSHKCISMFIIRTLIRHVFVNTFLRNLAKKDRDATTFDVFMIAERSKENEILRELSETSLLTPGMRVSIHYKRRKFEVRKLFDDEELKRLADQFDLFDRKLNKVAEDVKIVVENKKEVIECVLCYNEICPEDRYWNTKCGCVVFIHKNCMSHWNEVRKTQGLEPKTCLICK